MDYLLKLHFDRTNRKLLEILNFLLIILVTYLVAIGSYAVLQKYVLIGILGLVALDSVLLLMIYAHNWIKDLFQKKGGSPLFEVYALRPLRRTRPTKDILVIIVVAVILAKADLSAGFYVLSGLILIALTIDRLVGFYLWRTAMTMPSDD